MSALGRAGIAAERTREPGGSRGAEDIRRLLVEGDAERWDAISEALLLYAARRDHVMRLIKPALDAGTWIVADRFADSTFAYQGYGRGLPLDRLAQLDAFALEGFAADFTIVLDLPVAEGFARVGRRSMLTDRFEEMDRAFHERLRDGFLRIAAIDTSRCVVIDALPDRMSVHRAVVAAVSARFNIALSA